MFARRHDELMHGIGRDVENVAGAHLVGGSTLNRFTAQFVDRRRTGAQGYELTFTVNVIAQHLLLRGLEPLLARDAHVVLMGSSTHRGKKATFNLVPDPQSSSRPE